MSKTQKAAQAAVVWIVAIGLMGVMSLSGCKTNDGNPTDSPSAGFSKCLQKGDC